MANDNTTAPSSTTLLTITRIFNAPRELVWRAWTDPKHIMNWWGPKTFTAPMSKIDLRVGGRYHTAMKSPDGQIFYTTGVYREVTPHSKLVMTDAFADEQGNQVHASALGFPGEWPDEMLVTLLLDEVDGKTLMTLRHEGIPAGEIVELTKQSWGESFDKLDTLLAR